MSPEPTEDPLLGRTIADKYKIEALLGRGGMGAVYRARQTVLKRNVAVKVLNPGHGDESSFASRFKREAKTASMLDHINSLRILDFGQEPDGLLYLVMEFIDGRDLLRVMRDDWPLPTARIVDILSQVLAALAVAHDEGVLHRDLKPENIMIAKQKDDEGRPTELIKVCDFGIAKVLQKRDADGVAVGESTLTQTGTLTAHGMLVGTPEYMSPEHIKNETLDARSDLYAVGVMLYQMLAGKLPFQSPSAIKLVMMHVESEPQPPSVVSPTANVDKHLEAVCLRALKKMPGDRHASAREMRADLRAGSGASDGPAESVPAAAASTTASGEKIAVPETSGTEMDSTRRTKRSAVDKAGAALARPPKAAPRSVMPIVIAIVLATAAICAALLYSK